MTPLPVINPYLEKFLTLYSQSDLSNRNTRGLDDEFSERTYVPTKLDLHLTDRVFDPKTRLVVLTGNAGDGKTAFIKQVEKTAVLRGASPTEQTDNGSTFTFEGRLFRTLYDGSQDFAGQSNDAVLDEFFGPLKGGHPPAAGVTLLIAINEGRLRDFLLDAAEFAWLGGQLGNHLNEAEALDESLVMVNLNLRSVVDEAVGPSDSIFDRVLQRFLAPEFWAACQQCSCQDGCYVKYNVDTLSDPKHGPAAVSALKMLFQVTHLRKKMHITMRDLRSALSFTLCNKYTCDQIREGLGKGETFIGRFFYNAVFDPDEQDRLITLLREIDAASVTNPKLDNFVNYHAPNSPEVKGLLRAFDRQETDGGALRALFEARPTGTLDADRQRHENAMKYHRSMRRKLFFEMDAEQAKMRGFPHRPQRLLPFERYDEFLAFIRTGHDPEHRLRNSLTLAISRSERIYNEAVGRENLCVRTADNRDSDVKSFYSFPVSDFSVHLRGIGSQADYIENLPNAIYFRYRQKRPELEISLDLFEVLSKIRDGYVPTASEVKTFFLNLFMYKRQLMSHPSERIILTEDDVHLLAIHKTAAGTLVMSQL